MKNFFNILSFVTTALVIFVIGISGGELIDSVIDVNEQLGLFIMHTAILLVFFYIAIYLQLILHEGGHLLFGLAAGFRFISFRIGGTVWLLQDGSLVKKHYKVAGTGGQCLMAPGRDRTGLIPFIVYNMGGVTMNLLAAGLSWLLYRLFTPAMVRAFFLMMCGAGIMLALSNGLPLSTSRVNNDGWNTISGLFSLSARKAFADMLEITALQTDGIRLKDMEDTLFILPEDAFMNNSLTSSMAVIAESRLMDQHRFEEAETLCRKIIDMKWPVPGISAAAVRGDLIFIDILNRKNPDEAAALADSKTRKIFAQMQGELSILRTQYAYEKYILGRNGENILQAYKKARTVYPYSGEIETEDELIAILDSQLNQTTVSIQKGNQI